VGGETPLTSADAQFISNSGVAILLIDSPNQDFGEQTPGDPNPIGPGPQGTVDAQQAIAQAQSLDVSAGTAIFRDVEADSPISASYILSYYDAFQGSGYVAAFYENRIPTTASTRPIARPSPRTRPSDPSRSGRARRSCRPTTRRRPRIPPGHGLAFPVPQPLCEQHSSVAIPRAGFVPANWPSGAPNVDVDEFDSADTNLLWNGPKGPGAYTALQPYRVCDTRSVSVTWYSTECSGHPISQGGTLDVQITGVGGPQGQSVPSNAQSVALNVTAISGTAGTFLSVFPGGDAVPTASNLNVSAGLNQANLVVVP